MLSPNLAPVLSRVRSPVASNAGLIDELKTYFSRFKLFTRRDWLVYVAWVGLIASLGVVSSAFLLIGRKVGAPVPVDAFFIPIGAGIFALAALS
jgi:hypothetical protein